MQQRLVVAVSFGALVLVSLAYTLQGRGDTDFLSFYAGARLVGTPDLYSVEHAHRIQQEFSNPQEVRAFIRPPFYALALYPLGRLPYRLAQALWQLLNVAALAGFVRLWFPKPLAAVLVCWYFPIWINYLGAQDIPIVLLLVAWATRQMRRQKFFQAGMILALCSIKAHLFVLLPVLIVACRLWTLAGGLAAGGALLTAVSFAVAGRDWIRPYLALLAMNEEQQHSAANMPNLYGLFHAFPHAAIWLIIGACAVAAAAWYACRRDSLESGWTTLLCGSLLLTVHAFIYDAAMLLPAFLTVARSDGFTKVLPAAMAAGFLTLTLIEPRVSFLSPLSIMAVFGWLVYRGRHQVSGGEQ